MVHQIQIENVQGEPLSVRGLETIKGANIFFLQEDKIFLSLKKQNPSLRSVHVIKIYPQTVKLRIETYEAVAYMSVSEDTYILLSGDATPLAYIYERPQDLGEITYYQKLTNGEYQLGKPIAFSDIVFACAIAELVRKNGYETYSISIKDTNLIQTYVHNVTIQSANKGDTKAQLTAIQQVLYLIKVSGETIKSVDVRFEKMILEKW